MSVRINLRRAGDRIGTEFYSVGDVGQMVDVRDMGDDQLVPLGSFVAPDQAWLVLVDFFESPFSESDKVKWMSSQDMQWPED